MAEYFSHDYDAREDEKIIDLMGEHGWAGYGLFWGIVELLYKNGGKMRTQYDRIAFALNTHPDSVKSIVEKFNLFQIKNDFFSSKSVKERLKKRNAKSEQARANAYKRWKTSNADALQTQSDGNAIKERKEKEINKSKNKVFKAPTLIEVKEYCRERKNNVDCNKWMNHYTANGWMVGKNKMKDWRAAIRTWESNDFNTDVTNPKIHDRTKTEGAPENFGVPSPTAISRQEYLKSKK